ncbi:MAG: type VI secretion system baseplate subunit TssE [Gemmatimonadaceae bacterium]
MARTEIERIVQPSLLDRLTDDEPKVGADRSVTREESERAFRASVERDVEALLNTRRTIVTAPEGFTQVPRSVYEFGLIDTTGITMGTKAGRERILASLRDAIERFEPRLAETRIRLVQEDQTGAPQVRFVVEAILLMDRDRERVVFDTVLEVASGEYDVYTTDASSAGS